ncbi:hypothetical protein NBRC116594_40420 [Shimia sp. NS0008-38b]|uniref:substrate-binding periplasmic protein n=1 Tax=Shimia sp. NS0008-38b TaxID=3127653 RepID=UPI003107F2D1
MKPWNFLAGLALALGLNTTISQAATITAYTGALPPYTIDGTAELPGISHELLLEMGARAGVDIKIEYLPWKRAQKTVQETPNAMLFTATRTAKREALYGWIVEMAAPQEVFVTTDQSVDSFESGAGLSSVAILDGTPRERQLNDQGLTNLYPVQNTSNAAKMLNAGRVNAWYTLNQRAAWVYKTEDLDPADLVFGAPQRTLSNWLASNLEFDPAIAASLAKALDDMRADGTYDAILAKYLN